MANKNIGDVATCIITAFGYQGPATTLWFRPRINQNGVAIYLGTPISYNAPATPNANVIAIPGSGIGATLTPVVSLNQILAGLADGIVDVSVNQNMSSPFSFTVPGAYTMLAQQQAQYTPSGLQEVSTSPSYVDPTSGPVSPCLFAWIRAAGFPVVGQSTEYLDISTFGPNFTQSGSDFTGYQTYPSQGAQLNVSANGQAVNLSSPLLLQANIQYWWRVTAQVNGQFFHSAVQTFTTPAVPSLGNPNVISIAATFS